MGLPFLAYLLEDAQPSVLLGRGRIVPIAVPHAGRFALHKLAVYALRSPGEDAKRAKDLDQATTLLVWRPSARRPCARRGHLCPYRGRTSVLTLSAVCGSGRRTCRRECSRARRPRHARSSPRSRASAAGRTCRRGG